MSAFKLFLSDLGLLGAMADVTAKEVLTGENYFEEYKGAFTEQFIAQELISLGEKLYYYSNCFYNFSNNYLFWFYIKI